jgi:ribosome-associated protein
MEKASTIMNRTEEFSLAGHPYIELNNLLKIMGISASGGEAKAMIADGRVKVDGQVELRKRCKIVAGQVVEFEGLSITVKE